MEILIAEDDEDNAFAYREALKERKHFVTITNNGQDCVNAYKKGLGRLAKGGRESTSTNPPLPFDVVILDYMMPKKDGLQVAKEIFSVRPKQRVIFASAYIKDTVEESLLLSDNNEIIYNFRREQN